MGTSTVSKSRKNKAAKSALAVALALLLSFGGTLAWTSFSQRATNEMKTEINPGGRLHDDFIWSDAIKNKDVYVENFTDPNNGGTNIYVRVKLLEYLEIGDGAGEHKSDPAADGLTVYPSGANSNDKDTWRPWVFNDQTGTDADFRKYFNLHVGGSTQYMPTFNKDRYDLKADINGALTDKDENGNDAPFINYKDYRSLAAANNGAPYSETGIANYSNGITKTETHQTQPTTYSADLDTLDGWTQRSTVDKARPLWVCDTDGWAYWSLPVKPGETTGLYLNSLWTVAAIDDDWYYAIEAVGEFVTIDEVVEGTGANAGKYYFGKNQSADKEISRDVYDLLTGAAAAAETQESEFADAIQELKDPNTVAGSIVKLYDVEYVKLAQDGDRVLVLKNNCISYPVYDGNNITGTFGVDNRWDTSRARAWLNSAYLNSLQAGIKSRIVETTIKTPDNTVPTNTYDTKDKIFLLTEADVFGTHQRTPTSNPDHYTYGSSVLLPQSLFSPAAHPQVGFYWLRTPAQHAGYWAAAATLGSYHPTSDMYPADSLAHGGGYRPAFWLDLSS